MYAQCFAHARYVPNGKSTKLAWTSFRICCCQLCSNCETESMRIFLHTAICTCIQYGHGPTSDDRCKLDDSTVPVVPVNGGTILSFWGYTPMLVVRASLTNHAPRSMISCQPSEDKSHKNTISSVVMTTTPTTAPIAAEECSFWTAK